ncbi:MAG TPA: FxsA family protein, partial [Acidimicrobiia bacterium]
EGLGVWRRFNAQVAAGQVPGGEIIDGFLILVAGALLLTPGFITDAVGLLALFPPTRALLRRTLRRRFTSKVQIYRASASPSRPPDLDV